MSELQKISPLEFFKKHSELVGFETPKKIAYTTVRELVENSLDACEMAGIKPVVSVKVFDYNGVSMVETQDNGPGIPHDKLASALCEAFTSTKYVNRQHRGEFGVGGKMVYAINWRDTLQPFYAVTARIADQFVHTFKLSYDITNGAPKVVNYDSNPNSKRWHGLKVKFASSGNYADAYKQLKQYFDMTAIACPYAHITVDVQNQVKLDYQPVTNSMPDAPRVVPFHPHGIDAETLLQLSAAKSGMLETLCELQGVSTITAQEFLKWARVESFSQMPANERVSYLASKLHGYSGFRPPDGKGLSPVGEKIFTEGIRSYFNSDYLIYEARKGVITGNAFVVEVVAAWGGALPSTNEEGRVRIYRFANRIPLVQEYQDDGLVKALREIDVTKYDVDVADKFAFFVHIASTRVPFKTAGKEMIDGDIPELQETTKLVAMYVLRKLSSVLASKKNAEREATKMRYISLHLPQIARSMSELTGQDFNVINEKLSRLLGVTSS